MFVECPECAKLNIDNFFSDDYNLCPNCEEALWTDWFEDFPLENKYIDGIKDIYDY